jgi:hypothetical protein
MADEADDLASTASLQPREVAAGPEHTVRSR